MDERTAIIRGCLSKLFGPPPTPSLRNVAWSLIGKPIHDASGREIGVITSVDICADSFEGIINEKDIRTVACGSNPAISLDSPLFQAVELEIVQKGGN